MPEIDGLRFVAITSVVLYHLHGFVWANRVAHDAHDSFRAMAQHGYRGVNLFYAISGFILGLPFAAHYLSGGPAIPLRPYFLRRLTRLEPPYIVNLAICFTLLVLASGASVRALCKRFAHASVAVHARATLRHFNGMFALWCEAQAAFSEERL